MKKIILALLCALPMAAQVPVTPITQPHMTFLTAAGLPCAGCSLFTYVAGSTTPLATYVDSAGVSVNTNPIVLGADGGPATPSGSTGGIWLANSAYKLVLKSSAGATIWTADNIKGGGGLGGVCGGVGAIQIANSGVNGLTCDPSITINTTQHTLNVGTLPTNHVTIGALGTPTLWTFDTTSPATALASLGGGSVSSVGLTVPSWLTVAGSPITTSGTLAVTPTAAQTANQFIATPDGSTGPVGLRTIVPGDLPLGTAAAFGAVKCDNTTITCTAGVISTTGAAATCNTNGCYITLTGGTIIQWGAAGSCGSGTFSCNVAVTFPTAFSSTTNLSVSAIAVGGANNVVASATAPSTTTFNIQYGALVFVGGTGSNLTGSQTATWVAIGH
jgi:hypothetical protein